MATQRGGCQLGSPTVTNGGMTVQPLRDLKPGAYKAFDIALSFLMKSTAAAFNLVVGLGSAMVAEGSDDLDLVLNAILGSLQVRWDSENYCGILTPAQWRTVLAFMNLKDFVTSGFQNGTSCPISSGAAAAVKITMRIPIGLSALFNDGNIFVNGSERLKEGEIDYLWGATAAGTTPVVLANGTANITAVSVLVYAHGATGSASDIGNVWQVVRKAGLPSTVTLDPRPRLAVFDTQPAGGNPTTQYNVGPYSLLTPAVAQSNYQNERLPAGGADITARATPLIWPAEHTSVEDLSAEIGSELRVESVSGQSTLTLTDIVILQPTPQAVGAVAQRTGAGGPTVLQHPTPRSVPAGMSVSPAAAAFLPVRVSPGSGAPSATGSAAVAPTPAAASLGQAGKLATSSRAGRIMQAFFPGNRG